MLPNSETSAKWRKKCKIAKTVENSENSQLPNASKCFQMLPNASKCFQIAKTVSFQMLPNASKCFQMLPNSENSAK
jgi:hypothetical protein